MNRWSVVLPGAGLLAAVAFFLLIPPIPQDPAYHEFADSRNFLGVPNFFDVASNLPFLIIGLWGMSYVFRHREAVCVPGLELAYVVFFAGIFLTGLGSAYYHLAPANDPLVWDRLPMMIGFAGMFSIVVGEFVSARGGRVILIPLLILGALSVEYWAFTEARGAGDLRPYAVFQFLPLLLLPFILVLHKPVIGNARVYWVMLVLYALSKVAEFLDVSIFAATGLISGHTLKHLFAAAAAAVFLHALAGRR